MFITGQAIALQCALAAWCLWCLWCLLGRREKCRGRERYSDEARLTLQAGQENACTVACPAGLLRDLGRTSTKARTHLPSAIVIPTLPQTLANCSNGHALFLYRNLGTERRTSISAPNVLGIRHRLVDDRRSTVSLSTASLDTEAAGDSRRPVTRDCCSAARLHVETVVTPSETWGLAREMVTIGQVNEASAIQHPPTTTYRLLREHHETGQNVMPAHSGSV